MAMYMRLLQVSLVLGVMLSHESAAQSRNSRGLVAGIDLIAVSATSDSTPHGRGLGLGAVLGYGFTQTMALHLTVDLARVRDTSWRTSGHFGVLGRYAAPTRYSPHVDVGVGSRLTTLAEDRQLVGIGLVVGVGFEVPVRDRNSVEISLVQWHALADDIHEGSRVVVRNARVHGGTTRIVVGYRIRSPDNSHDRGQ